MATVAAIALVPIKPDPDAEPPLPAAPAASTARATRARAMTEVKAEPGIEAAATAAPMRATRARAVKAEPRTEATTSAPPARATRARAVKAEADMEATTSAAPARAKRPRADADIKSLATQEKKVKAEVKAEPATVNIEVGAPRRTRRETAAAAAENAQPGTADTKRVKREVVVTKQEVSPEPAQPKSGRASKAKAKPEAPAGASSDGSVVAAAAPSAPAPPAQAVPAPAARPRHRVGRITLGRAMSEYALSRREMDELYYDEVRNPHYRSAAPMRLYDYDDVINASWAKYEAKGTTLAAALAKRAAAAIKRQATAERNRRERAAELRRRRKEAARVLAERTAAVRAALQERGLPADPPRLDIPAWYAYLYQTPYATSLQETVEVVAAKIEADQAIQRRVDERRAAFIAAVGERRLQYDPDSYSKAEARFVHSSTATPTLDDAVTAYVEERRVAAEEQRRQERSTTFYMATMARGLSYVLNSAARTRYIDSSDLPLADAVDAYATELREAAEAERRRKEAERARAKAIESEVRAFAMDLTRTEHRMPTSLTNSERYTVHHLAESLKIDHISEGREPDRCLVLRRRGDKAS